MPSSTIDSERLLDRAIELLVTPTLENLRSVEDALREAIVRLPSDAEVGQKLAQKVRLCGRLLEGAETIRPAASPVATYSFRGERTRATAGRLLAEI